MNKVIEIVVEFPKKVELAAANRVRPRNALPLEQRVTEAQLMWYNDLIDNVFYMIHDYAGFNVTDEYQSTDSYSYYFEFEVPNLDGVIEVFTVKLRITDHEEQSKKRSKNRNSNDQPAAEVATDRKKIFRSLKVNGISQESTFTTINLIGEICDQLKAGNLAILDELDR